jgi:hypothetical protein
MGKKKKEKREAYYGRFTDEDWENPFPQEKLNLMADQLETYIEMYDNLLYCQNLTKKEYEEAVSEIKKAIKKLRKGKNLETVFDIDRVEESIANDPIFVKTWIG